MCDAQPQPDWKPELDAIVGARHGGATAALLAAYERAIALGLPPNELSAAFLGLGSALRCLGDYTRAEQVLQQGRLQFPEQREFEVYLAMTLHNLGRHAEALQLVLTTLIETADDVGIAAHQRAIRFHAAQLDRRWD